VSEQPKREPVLAPGQIPGPGYVGYDREGKFVHYCPVCGVFGAHGVGYFPREGKLGQWFCRDHKPK
jgi:hypothetical protein